MQETRTSNLIELDLYDIYITSILKI